MTAPGQPGSRYEFLAGRRDVRTSFVGRTIVEGLVGRGHQEHGTPTLPACMSEAEEAAVLARAAAA